MLNKARIKLWSIGGGKGGVGKSILTLGLGVCLANMGKKVILIDGDLGGANLHTLMGVRYPQVTLEDFLLRKVARLEDIILKTEIEGIGLICGADDILGAANPTFPKRSGSSGRSRSSPRTSSFWTWVRAPRSTPWICSTIRRGKSPSSPAR